MSDIEREEFEQAVADKWSDSYKFTRFGDEDYYDEVLEGMWRGWQASRQALEGEPVGTARRCEYDRDITYCEFEADEVPICTKLYTHPASAKKEIERWKMVAHDQADTISELQGLVHANRHTIKELREQNEKLQARVAELESDEQEMAGDNNV